jgi:hypothetical protein
MEGREMAYNPTTWKTDDVITKDRLNKVEQGIVSASKLSGTDIDTDKDWGGKNITNAGTISCAKVSPNLILKPAPEGLCTLLTLSLSGGSGTSATKTFHRIEGTGRVRIDISTSTVGTGWNATNVYNLYKNGTIVWTATISSGQSYTMPAVSESIELDVTSGDAFYLDMSINTQAVTFTATFRAAVSLALLDGITT